MLELAEKACVFPLTNSVHRKRIMPLPYFWCGRGKKVLVLIFQALYVSLYLCVYAYVNMYMDIYVCLCVNVYMYACVLCGWVCM